MFLTRMHLNGARRGTRWLMSSPQRMHAAVLSGFAPHQQTSCDEGRVLWRLDRGQAAALTLFISSPERPDLAHLVEQAGWPTSTQAWESADMTGFRSRITAGQRWVFRLSANPVAARRQEGSRSRVQGLRSVEDQTQWLVERAERCGFSIPKNAHDEWQLSLADRRAPSFDRRREELKDRVTLVTATYDGVLDVVDADSLRAALGHGIGRAKGYGCGLLTLALP